MLCDENVVCFFRYF